MIEIYLMMATPPVSRAQSLLDGQKGQRAMGNPDSWTRKREYGKVSSLWERNIPQSDPKRKLAYGTGRGK